MATISKINFDFTSSSQNSILKQLQRNKYKLFGYKGAWGTNQVAAGFPTWFTLDYLDVFGELEIDCEQLYKVYVYNKAMIGTNTTILMETLSPVVPLGTAVTLNEDGTFSTTNNAPQGIITVLNNRSANYGNITVGLASKVNGVYAPFCAFTSVSQELVSIKPNERVLLFAAQSDMIPGSVVSNALACGCIVDFNFFIQYNLQMTSNFCIIPVLGENPAMPTEPLADLGHLLIIP